MRIAIVGGGISGLAAAYELATRHADVQFTLYEASGRLGGIVETVRCDGFTIECGPDSWVTEKPWARELAEELGLAGLVIPSNDSRRQTYIVRDGRMVAMPVGMRMMVPSQWEPLLHSPLLGWQAKHAYLREPMRAAELKASALLTRGDHEDESVADFVVRHFGQEATTTLAGPLLAGVFGGDIHRLSAKAVMAPFVKMEAESGSLVEAIRSRALRETGPSGIFTTLKDGLGSLVDRIAATLPGAAIQLNQPVEAIANDAGQWRVKTASGEQSVFDRLILATPSAITQKLLATLQNSAADRIASLLPKEASSAICVALGFLPEKASRLRIPRGFGFLVPQGDAVAGATGSNGASLLAATFVDQKFNFRVPGGGVLLRGFFGAEAAERLCMASDTVVVEEVRQQLSKLLGLLPEPDVTVVRHWPQSLPQYLVGHVSRIAEARQQALLLPGMSLIGSAYHGVGLPDLIRDGRQASKYAISVRTAEAPL